MKVVRIANSSGYWGDDPEALYRQVTGGEVDYVTGDYLAEITMVILERQRRANPKRGYAYDFIGHLRRALPEIARRGIRIVVNAGGVNTEACREAIMELCRAGGVSIPIAIVDGGDLMPRINALREQGVSLRHLDTGEDFATIADHLVSAHAYLGARPIAEALDQGAQIVVTARVTDAAVALGPMIHEFGWSETDWDRLAAGTVAGHILECGGQATGGNYTDFLEVPLWSEKGWFGYPIVEIDETGDFVVTKHEGTAGLVNRKSITEQLLYEIGDPKAYMTPDVTCDFTSVKLDEVGRDRVRVSGAKGFPAPPYLKVSAVYTKGYRATGMVLLSGPRTRQKAEHLAQLLWGRLKHEFEDSRADLIGFDACWLGAAPEHTPNEGILRFGVRDSDRAKVEEFSRVLLGFGLQGPPGLGMVGGRPEVQEAFAFWPTLVPRHLMNARVQVEGGRSAAPFEVSMRLDAAAEPTASARSTGGPTQSIRGPQPRDAPRAAHRHRLRAIRRQGRLGEHRRGGPLGCGLRVPPPGAHRRGRRRVLQGALQGRCGALRDAEPARPQLRAESKRSAAAARCRCGSITRGRRWPRACCAWSSTCPWRCSSRSSSRA